MKFATVNYAADIAHSFGASKNVAGWVLAVCSMVSRPCSCQTSAKSFRKPCENAVRLPTGLPFGLPRHPVATSGHSHVWSAQEPFLLLPSVSLCAGIGDAGRQCSNPEG